MNVQRWIDNSAPDVLDPVEVVKASDYDAEVALHQTTAHSYFAAFERIKNLENQIADMQDRLDRPCKACGA